MDVEKQLMVIFNVVIDEMKSNKEFKMRIEDALSNKESEIPNNIVESKAKKRGRNSAVLNPNIIALKGEIILRGELDKLEVVQLKDIISQYAMDSSKLTNRWRSKEKLMNYIVEVSFNRISKGDVFR